MIISPSKLKMTLMPTFLAVSSLKETYIYGAENDRRQIAMVSDCALKKIATLPFNHYFGACAANEDRLFLCFDYHEDGKTCRMSNEPTGPFQETPKSTHTHIQTRSASSGSKLNLPVSQ